jgi:MFS family permease
MLGRFALLTALRHGHFRQLFVGQVVSTLGDWLNLLALLSLLLYEWDLGAFAWGAVLTASALPAAVVGPFAGVWADRWSRRTIMIGCDLARAVVVLGLIWAPDLPTVVVLVGLSSVFSAFFFPAQRSAIRLTVPEPDLLAASSLSQLANYGARLVGPALGGALVVFAGPRAAFAADSFSFLLSAAVLSRLPQLRSTATEIGNDREGFWEELRSGVACIRRRRVLLVSVGGTVALGLIAGATDALGTPVLKVLGVDEAMLGPSFTALGLGYVAAAVAVGERAQPLPVVAVLGLAMLGLGCLFVLHGAAVALGLTGVFLALIVAVPARLLFGMSYGSSQVASAYAVQQQTPAELMGRVSATARSLVTIVPLPAPLLAAWLAERWGLGQTYAAAGVALAVAAVCVLALRTWTLVDS